MADEDEDGSSGSQNDGDELAKKLERLTEEQQKRYNAHVHITLDRNGDVSPEYRLSLANTLLKNLPAYEEGREIGVLNSRQVQIAHQRDRQRDQPTPAKSPVQEAQAQDRTREPERNGAQPASTPQPKRENTLEGKTPSGPPRNYSGLERTHEEVGQQSKQNHAQRAGRDFVQTPHEAQLAVLSKERLVLMLEHFPEIRREANLGTSPSEIRERANLASGQDAERLKFDQTHGDEAKRTPQQHKERDLLDYQHLAEQVGTQAKWIARQLDAKRSPDAKTYKADAFSAMHTARVVQNQRQNQRAGIDSSQQTGRVIEADQPQHQAAQEAARGRALTSDERANLPADARSGIESKERSERARDTGPGAKDHKDEKHQQGPVRPGNSKGGGRSR